MKRENTEVIRRQVLGAADYEDKRIYGLEEGEEAYYKVIGVGYGLNLAHCFSMGDKNSHNFWQRAFAYQIIPNREPADLLKRATGQDYVSVQFYELA